jgi:HEAT repeat protein
VHSDESTLPDDPDNLLLTAGYRDDASLDDFIVAQLHDDVPRRRVLALRAARRRDIVTDDVWRTALGDEDVDVRREALTLIAGATLEDESLFALLIEALADDDALVVDGAVFALGEHLYIPALEQLITVASEHDDARCRESAIAALGAIGDDRARAVILAALEDKPAVRRRAIVALANFEGPDIDAALVRASEDRDWQVRAAVDQLGRAEE